MAGGGPRLRALRERQAVRGPCDAPTPSSRKARWRREGRSEGSGLWRLSLRAAWVVVRTCGKAAGQGEPSPEPGAARPGVDFNADLLL